MEQPATATIAAGDEGVRQFFLLYLDEISCLHFSRLAFPPPHDLAAFPLPHPPSSPPSSPPSPPLPHPPLSPRPSPSPTPSPRRAPPPPPGCNNMASEDYPLFLNVVRVLTRNGSCIPSCNCYSIDSMDGNPFGGKGGRPSPTPTPPRTTRLLYFSPSTFIPPLPYIQYTLPPDRLRLHNILKPSKLHSSYNRPHTGEIVTSKLQGMEAKVIYFLFAYLVLYFFCGPINISIQDGPTVPLARQVFLIATGCLGPVMDFCRIMTPSTWAISSPFPLHTPFTLPALQSDIKHRGDVAGAVRCESVMESGSIIKYKILFRQKPGRISQHLSSSSPPCRKTGLFRPFNTMRTGEPMFLIIG